MVQTESISARRKTIQIDCGEERRVRCFVRGGVFTDKTHSTVLSQSLVCVFDFSLSLFQDEINSPPYCLSSGCRMVHADPRYLL